MQYMTWSNILIIVPHDHSYEEVDEVKEVSWKLWNRMEFMEE